MDDKKINIKKTPGILSYLYGEDVFKQQLKDNNDKLHTATDRYLKNTDPKIVKHKSKD
jgi:hypothetical protein